MDGAPLGCKVWGVSSLFDIADVPVATTSWVMEQARQKRGGWIYGPLGSGKSHAVRAASLGGVHVDVVQGPLLGQRFAADLACQLGADGRRLLEAARHDGLAAALVIAEEAIDGRPFVVDAAEQLLLEPISLDDPFIALWRDDKVALKNWLIHRLEHSPTFLVSRWRPGDGPSYYRHRMPTTLWPQFPAGPDVPWDWLRLARLARNPGVFVVARALVPLIPGSEFNALLDQADEDEGNLTALFQRLGQAFQSSAPKSWQRVLALVGALGEAPRDVVEFVLGIDAGTREPEAAETLAAFHRLQQLELVEERAGRIAVLPVLHAFGVRSLTEQERSELLPAAAHHLLAPINEIRSLEPEHAARVLLAHSIFVSVGDMGNAERTAVLHVHGLVELARRTSLNERFSIAWQQYDSVLRMVETSGFGVADHAGRRLVSYVRHYRAWNGFRAGALDDVACLHDYEQALDGWPENALWHQRLIQALIRLGRFVEARRAVERGYQRVEGHPRRDELLRIRPAWTALEVKALQLSLDLLEPTLDATPARSPEVADGRDALLRRWKHGLRVEELTFSSHDSEAEGRVTLLQPTEVYVRRFAGNWLAEMPSLWAEGKAESPGRALEALARNLGEEARRLIATITSDLSDKDVRRKGVLLSYVDALNSDIGLAHARDRWIVGRIEGRQLIPTMRHLPPVEVAPELMPQTTEGLYIARVPVYRDGVPSGPAEAIKPAGSGFGYGELVKLLELMNEDVA
jgi:hypothetical protein